MPNLLDDLYKECSSNDLDVLWMEWRRVSELGIELPQFYCTYRNKISHVINGVQFMEQVCSTYLFAWAFLYKRCFLQKNSFLFMEGILYEDVEFNTRVFPLINRIKIYSRICYNYTCRHGSILNSISEKRIEDLIFVCFRVHDMFLQTPYKFYKRILSDSIISIFLLLETSNSRKLKNIFFEQMKTRNIRTIIYTGTLIRKLLCFTFNLSPRLCSHVVHFMLVIRKFLKR